jgi:mono/diheme cytochrome c family protein
MISFKKQLSPADIDNVTAYLRSRASGWTDEKPVL